MKLNQLSDNGGARTARKRVGRGIGSGTGKTSGKGMKGQKSRSGVAIKGFEGGQMPIYRRLPKRGFTPLTRKRFQLVNLGRLQAAITAGRLDPKQPVTEARLLEVGLVNRLHDGVRLLAKGKIEAGVTLEVTGASAAAIAAVEAAGGKVVIAAPVRAAPVKTKRAKGKPAKGEKATAPASDADGSGEPDAD